ncbi:adventurous gliding motility protein AgmC [Corallococcus terminator]
MRTLLTRVLLWGVLLMCGTASAELDRFGLSDGSSGNLDVKIADSPFTPNKYVALGQSAAQGATILQLTGTVPPLAANDLVMIIQSTGLSPVPTRGTQTAVDLSGGGLPTVGQWELAQVQSSTTTSVTLTRKLAYSYTAPGAQLVTVPRYQAVTVRADAEITAAPWDGSKGGVLAFLANGALTNNGTIDASGLGLRGGAYLSDSSAACGGSADGNVGQSGEDIVPAQVYSVQNSTNGGGGGSCNGGGGGGGGNGGWGGVGGYGKQGSNNINGGKGGVALSGSTMNWLTFGGGGGSGHLRSTPPPTGGAGGRGGGIIFIRAASLSGVGSIVADGEDGVASSGTLVGHGGGAGGTLHLRFTGNGTCDPDTVTAVGGKGSNSGGGGAPDMGPGGGGGGGRVFFQAKGPTACSPQVPAGLAGFNNIVHRNGALPTSAADPDSVGTVTLVDTAFATPNAPVLAPVGPPARTNNPLLRGTTQQGLSEVVLYEVTGTTPNLTYTYWGRTASDSLKSFVHVFTPPSNSPNTAYRIAAQAGLLGAYSAMSPELNFTFDNVPPTTTLTPHSVPPISSSTIANFTFSSTETSTYRCARDSTLPLGDAPFVTCPASYVASPLGNGDYRVTVYAIDEAGNQDPNPKSFDWKVDTSVPNTAITGGPVASPPGAPTSSKIAVFTFSGGVTYQCSRDGGMATACGPTQTYTNLTDGAHTMEVTAYSAAGTPDPSPATHAWRVDTLVPDTSFTDVPPADSNSASALFNYQSPDDSTATFQCSVDGLTFTSVSCPGTGTGSRTLTGLTPGSNQFHVRAVDAAGNVDPSPVSYTWRVDLTAPTSILVASPNAGWVRSQTPTIAGTTEAGARVVVTVRLTSSGATLQTLSTVASSPSGSWSVVPAALDQERYTLRARATDAAGNFVESADAIITVDTVAPVRPVLNPSILGVYYTAVPITLDGTLESTVGLNLNTAVTVYVDDSVELGPATVNASGDWSVTYSPSPADDGFHWVRAMSRDPAGNVSAFSGTLTFHVDRKDPAKPVVASLGTYVNTQYPALSGTAEVGTSLRVYFGSMPEPVTVSVGPGGQWSYLRTTPLNEGPNSVFVRSTDGAGRFTDSDPVSFTVDVTKPETIILDGPPFRDAFTTVDFQLARPEPLTYECRRSTGGVTAEAFTPCPPLPPGTDASFIQLTNLVDGPNTLMVRAVDAAGNRDDSPAFYNWTINTGPLSTEIEDGPSPGPISETDAVFLFSSNKGEVDFECKLEQRINPDPALDFSPCPRNIPADLYNVARYSNLQDNTYTLSVRAVFAGQRDSVAKVWIWEVDTSPPTLVPRITAPQANLPTNEDEGKPVIRGQSPELKGTITLYKDGGIWGTAEVKGGLWTFSPLTSLESGQYQITATLTDLAKNVGPLSAPYTLSIDLLPPEVTILLGPQGWLTTDSFSFTFAANEPLERFECLLDGSLEYEACVSPHTGTVNSNNETHTMVVRAIDIAGNVSPVLSRTWKVDTKLPNTTILTETKERTNSQEARFLFESNENNVVYFCSLNEASYESCNPTDYRWTGLGSTDVDDTKYTLRVKARDQAGNEDPTPEEFIWRVDLKAPVAPVLSIPRANDILSVRTPTFQGDAEAESTVSIQLDGVEIGTVQADASGDWRFVPRNALDYGSHTVTLVAKDKAGNASVQSAIINFVLDPSLEIDARGGGLSCASAGGGGGTSLVLLVLGGLALRVGRRRRES